MNEQRAYKGSPHSLSGVKGRACAETEEYMTNNLHDVLKMKILFSRSELQTKKIQNLRIIMPFATDYKYWINLDKKKICTQV